MKHIQTRESVRKANSCYSNAKIDALVPPEGNTPRQVAELSISDEDRLWGLIHSCGATQQQLVEFACKCARRCEQSAVGLRAIETADRWLRGEATAEDCRDAAYADAAAHAAHAAYAADAAAAAERYAAYAAAAAERYAAYAAAASAAERKWQINCLVEILEHANAEPE